MNTNSISTTNIKPSGKAASLNAAKGARALRLKTISDERVNQLLEEIEENLTEGLSGAAENIITETLDSYAFSKENQAKLISVLSYTFETQGRYAEALKIVEEFESEENLKELSRETKITVLTRLAISHSNTADFPKAVALLKKAQKEAENVNLKYHLGSINVALSRVYRKLNEFPISRDYAEKGLNYFRETGSWRGMAESYQTIAGSFHQEGNSEKSLEYFQLAVKIIGDRSAPFLLGKIYSDMSGAFWFLRRPQEGIACLEKSIEFFDRTEHKIQSIAAYNNLGINLMQLGNWAKAEIVIKRALEIAIEVNHVHVAGILDSLGELKLLRGEFENARELLEEGVRFAEERKKEWYAIQAMRNLARCLLAQGEIRPAKRKANETIALCEKIGEKQVANMARLVLAESYLEENNYEQCEKHLKIIEETDPTSDFFVLGNIQRIRGLSHLKINDEELAVYHLKRSLTIFETADDLYHTALIHYLIGKIYVAEDPKTASTHLIAASERFRKIGVEKYHKAAEDLIEKLKHSEPPRKKTNTSAGSQLLMLRLAESVASRELLFRELAAVLAQESKAKRLIITELNDRKKFYPFIAHGFIPAESMELVSKLNEETANDNIENFAKTKNITVFQLKPPNAPPAQLIIYPRSGAVLNDGGQLQPLLRVVELGMDVCSLREKDKPSYTEEEASPFTSQSLLPGFIHSSPAMTALVEEVYKIRSSDVTVLVTGESGTGKELVSRAIHTISSRKDKVFVPFNCTAIPKELAEGHLFGYRKGAFTGAVTDSPGLIRAADGGTLFLDEVGDLPLDVQPKLLRFLQEGEIQPIGEKKPIKVDVRVIAATNMPLEDKVETGSFREDLYYRLNVIRLRVPPLRERRSEIPPMVNYYINHYSAKFGRRDISITPQAIDLLMVCDWDGNVRQLCNEIQRLVARAEDGETIMPEHLSVELKRNATPISAANEADNVRQINSYAGSFFNFSKEGLTIEEAVSELEIQMISDALRRHDWNISRVARELGLTRRGLYLKLSRYGIEKAA